MHVTGVTPNISVWFAVVIRVTCMSVRFPDSTVSARNLLTVTDNAAGCSYTTGPGMISVIILPMLLLVTSLHNIIVLQPCNEDVHTLRHCI